MRRQQQHKEIGGLFDCEPKRVTENRIKEHFVDDKLGGDGSSGQYQEPHNLNKGQGSLNLSILLVIITHSCLSNEVHVSIVLASFPASHVWAEPGNKTTIVLASFPGSHVWVEPGL